MKITKLLIILSLLVLSNQHLRSADVIILYGNDKCVYCKETMRWLDEQKISYTYRDVMTYGTYQEEMYNKITKAGYNSTAKLPVLDVNGQILMNPRFDEIKRSIKGEKINTSTTKKQRTPSWRPEKNKSLNTDLNTIKSRITVSDLIIYDDDSRNSKNLLKKISAEGIPCTVKHLNTMGNAGYFNMSSRLTSLGYGNMVKLPVVEVRGEMIMNATFDDTRILLIEMLAD